jgi:hypothetical protein
MISHLLIKYIIIFISESYQCLLKNVYLLGEEGRYAWHRE